MKEKRERRLCNGAIQKRLMKENYAEIAYDSYHISNLEHTRNDAYIETKKLTNFNSKSFCYLQIVLEPIQARPFYMYCFSPISSFEFSTGRLIRRRGNSSSYPDQKGVKKTQSRTPIEGKTRNKRMPVCQRSQYINSPKGAVYAIVM